LARGQALRAPQREQMMRQGAGGLFGVDTRTAGQQVQEQLADLDVTTPAGQRQAVKLIAQVDAPRALALQNAFSQQNVELEEAKKDAGTVVKGTTFTVQDENNNAFTMIPTLNNKTGKFENKFAPIGGGPSTPVGKTVITGGEFAQTATDDALRRINKDISTTEGQEFVKNKATALDTIPVLSAQKEELSQALTLLDSVETGGPINLIGTALENYFGTKSADKATLEIILGDNTFKALKPLFGGLISEGERAEIMKIYPNLQKGNAANRGIILRLQNILDNALLRGQMYQRSDTVEDYKRLMDKLYPVDADKKPTENVVVWGVRD
jgi:hypothetical protein